MAAGTIYELEANVSTAYQNCSQSYDRYEAANSRAEAAKSAYQDAMAEVGMMQGFATEDQMERVQNASEEMQKANQELNDATSDFEADAQAAQEAEDALNQKMEELEAARGTDISFVVNTARVQCSCGMRDSCLTLGNIHGMYTNGLAQMTVMDSVFNENVINFGGCNSAENPSTQEAIAKAIENGVSGIQQAKAEGDFLHQLVGSFIEGKGDEEADESLTSQCFGECTGAVLETKWGNHGEKTTINGENPLLRRCELKCKFGGEIKIILSGQPE